MEEYLHEQHGPPIGLIMPRPHLPTVVACLVLGTLYAVKNRTVRADVGVYLASGLSNQLEGLPPAGLVDVLQGMDELTFGRKPHDEFIDEQIQKIEAVLRELHPRFFIVDVLEEVSLPPDF